MQRSNNKRRRRKEEKKQQRRRTVCRASWERCLQWPDSSHQGAAGCFQVLPRCFSRQFNQTLDAPPRPRTAASSPPPSSSSSSLALCSFDSQTGCSLFLPQCHLSPITWRYANSRPVGAPDISAVIPQIDSCGKHVHDGLSSPAGAPLPFSHVVLFIHHSEVCTSHTCTQVCTQTLLLKPRRD